MRDPPVIAYLNSAYARASDTFIRTEVSELRALGHVIHTYSIRRPAETEVVDDDVRRERSQTKYILTRANSMRLLVATIRTMLRSPVRLAAATILALRCSSVGLKARVWAFAYVVEACFLAERLKATRADHLHNHFGEGSATVAMLTALLAGLPFSLTIHGATEFDRPATLALDQKIARAAFVVAVSEWGRSQLMRWCDVADWHKIRVIHCGVDPRFLEQKPAPVPDAPRFLYVGRLDAGKGLVPLVEATATVAAEGTKIELVIAGDGPMRAEVERLIDRYRLRTHVDLRGWLGSDGIRNELLRARALVLPSFSENLPVVIMEAFVMRRPVISTHIGGIPELVTDGACGWLVPAGSAGALAEALKSAAVATPAQLERMGNAGFERVARQHNARVEATKMHRLLVAHRSRARSPVEAAVRNEGKAPA